jgi:hypothetical protein
MKKLVLMIGVVVGLVSCEKDILIDPIDPTPIDTVVNPIDTTPPPPPPAPSLPCFGIDTLQVDSVYRPNADISYGWGKYGPTWINGDHNSYEFCGVFKSTVWFSWDQGNPYSTGLIPRLSGYRAGFMNGVGNNGIYVMIVWQNGWHIVYGKSISPGRVSYQGSIPVYLNPKYPSVIFNETGKAMLVIIKR